MTWANVNRCQFARNKQRHARYSIEPGVSDPKSRILASFWQRPGDIFRVPVSEMEEQVHARGVRIAEAKCLVEGDSADAVTWKGSWGVKMICDRHINCT